MPRAGQRALAVVSLTVGTLLAGAAAAAPAQAAPQPVAPTPLPDATARLTAPRAAAPGAFTESLAPTPPMGFNNWNAFGCDVSAALMKQTADVLVSSGLKDAGYTYVNIDDCWSLRQRGTDGRLVPDPVKFPDGIAGVADYVHSKGLKLGIYGDAGTRTCAGYPGSLGHEEIDAQTWASWGIDYLKYDNCNNQSDGTQADFIRRYTAMRNALDRVDRPIVYSVCEWGQSRPWLWAAGVGDLWRTTGDISDNWSSVRNIIAQNVQLAPYAGPGHWNDPDMLEIGNGGMTNTEYRTHMSMWAMMASPLIIGTDLRDISAEHLAILEKREIIAIDQDRLGVQGKPVVNRNGTMVLDKPLSNGERAIALYNSTDALATVSVDTAATGLPPAEAYRLQDVWTGQVTQARSTISAAVPAHGTVVYRVRQLDDPDAVAPSVVVGAGLGVLVPGTAEGATLSTTATNRGAGAVKSLTVTAHGPDGWTVTPAGATSRPVVASNASLSTTWTVRAPAGTKAGRYPITVTASYVWGGRRVTASSTSEVTSVAVTAPDTGRRYLSSVLPVTAANAVGPVELDQSNGGQSEGDGALITVGGQVFTRGLGTTAGSDLVYYLGGQCTSLVTSVGVDDEPGEAVPATFTVYADDRAVAASGEMNRGDAPRSLTADLTGATWLRLAATGTGTATDGTVINTHADWAQPVLSCGETSPNDPVLPVEQTLFSFESGTEGFAAVNADPGGSVSQSSAFHTDGAHGLHVTVPTAGNWFGTELAEPLNLTGKSRLKFDVRTADMGTSGEISMQVGPDRVWCQGGLWAWTNPNSSRTVTEEFDAISCPSGTYLDLSQIRSINVFLNGSEVVIDNIRAE